MRLDTLRYRHSQYYAAVPEQLLSGFEAVSINSSEAYTLERAQIEAASSWVFSELGRYGNEPDALEQKLVYYTYRSHILVFNQLITAHSKKTVQDLMSLIFGDANSWD